MKLIVKGEEDDSFKRPQPFVFHGKDVVSGERERERVFSH